MMLNWVLRRLLLLIPILLAASLLVFLMLHLGVGDPAMDYLRLSGVPPTPDVLAATREMLGLNAPLPVQYWHWLIRAVRLDFGVSYATQRPVLDDLLHFLPATLQLAGLALVMILVISVPLGIWAARYPNRLPDHIVRAIAFLGVSMPNFWLAFLLVMLFSVKLNWLPAMGYGGWRYMILPAVSIAFMSLSINARLLRTSMLEVAGQRHVTWRGCGLNGGANRAPPCAEKCRRSAGHRAGNAYRRADWRHADHRKHFCLARRRALRRLRHF